jgi:type II secretory ATPase GspE/PulE/Tfp pilus assembly ATPase PilB-like protein
VTFASALRTVLRQDPDIIMVGEIRDTETAEHAVQARLTGHLVLSTLHTNDAPFLDHAPLDLGIPHFLITTTLIGILAQRLVREICPHCTEEYEPTPEEAVLLKMDPEKLKSYSSSAAAAACTAGRPASAAASASSRCCPMSRSCGG